MKEKLIELFEAKGFKKTSEFISNKDYYIREILRKEGAVFADRLSLNGGYFEVVFNDYLIIDQGQYSVWSSYSTPTDLTIKGKLSELTENIFNCIIDKLK